LHPQVSQLRQSQGASSSVPMSPKALKTHLDVPVCYLFTLRFGLHPLIFWIMSMSPLIRWIMFMSTELCLGVAVAYFHKIEVDRNGHWEDRKDSGGCCIVSLLIRYRSYFVWFLLNSMTDFTSMSIFIYFLCGRLTLSVFWSTNKNII
jgi:hypothetical protein